MGKHNKVNVSLSLSLPAAAAAQTGKAVFDRLKATAKT